MPVSIPGGKTGTRAGSHMRAGGARSRCVEVAHEALRRPRTPRVRDQLAQQLRLDRVEPDEHRGTALPVRRGEEGARIALGEQIAFLAVDVDGDRLAAPAPQVGL